MIPIKDRNPTRTFPYVTVLLILVNLAVFVLVQRANSDSNGANRFTFEHAAIPCELSSRQPLTQGELVTGSCDARLRSGQILVQTARGPLPLDAGAEPFPHKNVYLAVLVSMFLHSGWLHLGGNMLFLWVFGNNVEDLLGPVRYLAFYVAGGLVATAAYLVFNAHSTVPVVGASGAIAVIMGAYLAWYPRAKVLTLVILFFFGLFVELQAYWVLLAWFVLQFFTGPGSGVAWTAHVGGFAFGFVIAIALRRTPWYHNRRELLPAKPT